MRAKQVLDAGLTRREFLRRAVGGSSAALLSGGFGVSGCGNRPPRREKPNIILVSIDTLRADHLGCYGYERDTSRNIDRFAAESILYTNAYAATPWTLPSHAGMLTGIHPFELGMYTEKSRIPDEAPLAAEFLKSAGYQTAAFVDSAPKGLLGGERGFARGFDRFDHAPFRPDLQYKYDIAVTVEEAQKWLTRIDKNRPFFLFLHTKSVHDTPNVKDGDPRGFPYDKPQPYRLRYLADEQAQFNWRPPFGIYLRYHNVLLANGKLKPKDYPPQRLEALKGQYDAGIYYTDEYFAKLLVILEQMGLSVNTIVILTADHGEAFLEHRFFHHIEVYNQLLHVPLIVRLPYQHGRRTIETPVALEDIVPTILNLADIDVPKVLTSKPLPTEPVPVRAERPFYGYYQFGSNVFLDEFSLLKGDWKLVYLKYSEGKWQAELYNITNDRGEFNPVVGRDDIETNMRKSLLKWMTTQPKFGSADITLDPKTIEHLRSLGYVD